ncbi:hypothetical protein QOT17_013740 [Balamuthia mandrillaris]
MIPKEARHVGCAIFSSVVALVLLLQVLYSFSSYSSAYNGNDESAQTHRSSYEGLSPSSQLRVTPLQPSSSSSSSSGGLAPLSNRCLVFWHIKKTGGTTLRHILLKDSQLRNRTFSWQQGFSGGFTADVVLGHAFVSRVIDLLEQNNRTIATQNEGAKRSTTLLEESSDEEAGSGKHEETATGAECYWMMSLRDPMERFLSKFFFKKQWGDSVEDFVLNNPMFAFRSFRLLRDQAEFSRLSAMLHRFNLIVLTERFDESLLLLTEEDRMVGEEAFLNYTNFGILHGRPKASDLPQNVRQRLEELLHFDILLYRQAEKLWEEKVRRSRFGGEKGLRARLEELQTEKGVHRGCAKRGEAVFGGSGRCKEFASARKRL